VFFGGIAQYYNNNGTRVKDDNVPFVKTIARVTRDSNGVMTEHLMPLEMPSLLGASAEFIPNKNLNHFSNEVIKLDDINNDSTLVGYIYGGINSSAPNIFFVNTGSQSEATSKIFKVLLTNSDPLGRAKLANTGAVKDMNVYPNPNNGTFTVSFYSSKIADITILLKDITGKEITDFNTLKMKTGWNSVKIEMSENCEEGIYLLTLKSPHGSSTRKIIVK